MGINRTSSLQAQLNRKLDGAKAKDAEGAEEAKGPDAAPTAEASEAGGPKASQDGFDGVGRNVRAGLQVAALQAKLKPSADASGFDEALADVRKRDGIERDLKEGAPGTAEGVARGLGSENTFARYGAAALAQEAPTRLAGHEDIIAAAGTKESVHALRAMADAGNGAAGAHLDEIAEAAPEGYGGDSTRAAAGVENRAWSLARRAKAEGHEPLGASELRASISPDPAVRGPALDALSAKAAAGHPQAVSALVSYAKGDAPGVRDYDAKETIAQAAADALASGGAKHLTPADVDALVPAVGQAGRVLDAAAAAGNPHVVATLREEVGSAVKYGFTKDREAAALVKSPAATADDVTLAMKGGGIPGVEGRHGGQETGHARAAVTDKLKAGDPATREAVNAGFGDDHFRVRSHAHAAAQAAPEQVTPGGVARLKAAAVEDTYAHDELKTLGAVATQDTAGGAAARAALGELATRHPRAKSILADAELAVAPAHARPLEELRRGPLTAELSDRVVERFDQLDPGQRREAIDLLKGKLDGSHPDTDAYRALGKLAPHLTKADVDDIARSTPPMPSHADRDAEKYYRPDAVQRAKNGFRFDTGRMTAKRDALRAALEQGADPAVKDAAFDGLTGAKFDRMDGLTTRALAGHVSQTGDVERGLKLQDRVPGTRVVYPPDAHERIEMSDARAREVLADPDKWQALDGHNGVRPQGEVSLRELRAAAADPTLSPDVRAAAAHYVNKNRVALRDLAVGKQERTGFRYDETGESYDFTTRNGRGGRSSTTREYQLGREVIDARRFSRGETSQLVAEGRRTRDGFVRESTRETRTVPAEAESNVEGNNFLHGIFFSDSPQDLRDELSGRVKKEVTTTSVQEGRGDKRVTTEERFFTTDSRGRVDREVLKTSREGAQNQWIAKKRNADGSYDTQSFIQGTEDTVLTRNTTKNGWSLKTSQARMGDTREAVQEANRERGSNIPAPAARTDHVEAHKENAGVRELHDKLRELGLGEAERHEAVKQFTDQMAGRPFSIAFERTTDSDGKDQAVLVAEARDGTRLAVATDEKTGGVASQADLGEDLAVVSSSKGGRDRLDVEVRATEDGFEAFVSENGSAFKKDPEMTSGINEVRDTLGHTKTALDRGKDLTRIAARGGRRAGTVMRGFIDQVAHSPRFGRYAAGLDKGIVGISAVSGVLALSEMASGVVNGDAKQVAQGATGLAVDASNTAFGVADLLQRTGKVSSTSSRLATTLKASKWLGGVGGVAQMGFAVNDLMGGDTFRGAVGLVGGGATIMTAVGSYAGSAAAAGTVWSTLGWMGPVGAVTALAATGLLAGYGHVEGTRIAEPEIF